MQNPREEVVPLVRRLCSASDPSRLREDIERYFTWDASFRHPLCGVASAPNSRERILGIYSHYRALSPNTVSQTRVVAYDRAQNVLVIETVQVFHLFFSLFKPAPSRLVTMLTLREENGLYYIACQEDFYHPDHFMNLLVPPLAPIIRLVLTLATLVSVFTAYLETFLGLFPLRGAGHTVASLDRAVRRRGLRNKGPQNLMDMPITPALEHAATDQGMIGSGVLRGMKINGA